jgi:hypothetical protein
MKGKDLHEATFYRGRAPFYAVIGSMLFWGLLFIGWLHLRSMNNAMETKRDGDKNGALMTAKGADEYLWGSYRGNIYFGMRMAKPTAISTGMMWFGMQDMTSCKRINWPYRYLMFRNSSRVWCSRWPHVGMVGA